VVGQGPFFFSCFPFSFSLDYRVPSVERGDPLAEISQSSRPHGAVSHASSSSVFPSLSCGSAVFFFLFCFDTAR